MLHPSTSCAPASSSFFDRVWALFLQSLPCRLVTFTVFSYVVTHTGFGRPTILTSMLKLSWNTPLVCYCAAAFHASSFDLLCFCFLKCAVSFCCCGVFSFDLCFCVLPCVMYFISFRGGGFFYCVNDFLVSFFKLGQFNIECSSYPIVSCFFSLFLVWMSFPSMVIKKIAMTHLWSLPMWVASLASASLTCPKYLLLVRM